MKQSYINTLFVVAISLYGCIASTDITSYTDPLYRTVKFKRICVIAQVNDISWRQYIEAGFANKIRDLGAFAIEGMDIFPPTRHLSEEQKSQLLLDNNIDACLVIYVGEKGINEEYVPPTIVKEKNTDATVKVSSIDNSATIDVTETTKNPQGYTISRPWASFGAKIFDANNGQVAWFANADTYGNGFASFETVINSFCNEAMDRLKKNIGLINTSKSNSK